VDFCCLSLKLVVELDGAGHAQESQATRDRQRDRELEKAVIGCSASQMVSS
jgi:very-short-patch-repair endonuclease